MSTVRFMSVDLETTGLAPPDEIIEVGWCEVYWDTEARVASVTAPKSALFSTDRPITPENRAVHHIGDAELATAPRCTPDHLKAILLADPPFAFVAANCAFERQWITEEIVGAARWICTVKAASRLYPDAESCSNQAIRYRMKLDLPDEWAMPPHRAGPDAYVTGNILADMLKGTLVRDLLRWTAEPRWMARCPLTKHRGKSWGEVPADYLDWVTTKAADMDADTRWNAQRELERRRAAA